MKRKTCLEDSAFAFRKKTKTEKIETTLKKEKKRKTRTNPELLK